MEAQRKNFWRIFLANFNLELKNIFAEGPKPFKNASEKIYNNILSTLISLLDNYLILAIAHHIHTKKSPSISENSTFYYDEIFTGGYEKTLEMLSTHYSPTLITIYTRCRLFKFHFTQACTRIFTDWEEIKHTFHINDHDTLTSARFFTGDPHGNGGQTSLMIFNNGNKGFAYKPTDISVVKFFFDTLAYIENTYHFSCKKIPAILVKSQDGLNHYGYIDYIRYQGNIKNHAEAEKVYENFGKMLAFARFFNIADGHSDNIIIHAPDVYWIDLENAFYFAPENFMDNTHALEVTGLLYEARKETTLLGIYTGIQGGTMPLLNLTKPLPENDGTDNIYIRYFGVFEASITEKHNRIYLQKKLCQPADFIENIKNGYLNTMRKFLMHKQGILDFIKNYLAQNTITVRCIFQATSSYSRYLNLMSHPVALKNGDVLQKICAELAELSHEVSPFKEFLLENELMDLCNHTIPYFYKTSKDKHIYHSSGVSAKNFFAKDLFTEFSENVDKLNLFEVENDLNFIDKALQSTADINSWEYFKHKFDYPEFNYAQAILGQHDAGVGA